MSSGDVVCTELGLGFLEDSEKWILFFWRIEFVLMVGGIGRRWEVMPVVAIHR